MRLIDADALVKFLKGCTMSNGTLINTNTMLAVVEKMPTAYDVEKVVAELEEKAKFYRDRRFHHQTIGNIDKAVAFGHKEDAVRKSIDIVKKGGVE